MGKIRKEVLNSLSCSVALDPVFLKRMVAFQLDCMAALQVGNLLSG